MSDQHPDKTPSVTSEILHPVDFFISYTAVDRQHAEWIAWQLEDAGYNTFFDKWDFRPGNNFVLLMQYATTVAKHTIGVLSPSYLEALYTQPEWAATFADDPIGKSRKFIPVRVVECNVTGILKPIVYIDLVDCLKRSDENGAKEALLIGIKDRAKPKCPPAFPAC